MISRRRTNIALVILALGNATAGAQEVTGIVREESRRTPLAGAVVVLTAPSGTRLSATLTDETGSFRLRAPVAGNYGLRVDVIGYRSVHVPAFPIEAAATLTRDILFRFERTQLPTVIVTAASACAQVSAEARDAGNAPRLWAEARKTLEAANLAIEEKRFNVALSRFERTVGLPDSVLRASRTWTQTGVTTNPYETLSPATVAKDGFSVRRDTSRYYYAPDAAILLSDAFVGGHCFGTRRDGPAGSVGLTFRPQQPSSRVDISGVLWLDSATAELRAVEYSYVTSRPQQDRGGGMVGFGRFPSGLWGVQRWTIRFPVLHVTESRRRPDGAAGRFVDTVVVALHEVGGEVVTGGSSGTATATRLRGTVFDSTTGAPLVGAVVTIEGLGRTATTDSLGQFAFDSLADEGEVRVRAWHPRLDSLGFDDPLMTVRLRRRGEATARLAVPGIAEVSRIRCAARNARRVIMGLVRSSMDTMPAAASEVVLLERRGVTTGGSDSLVRHTEFTSDGGRYAFCDVAPRAQAWLLTRTASEWSDPRHVTGDAGWPVDIVPLRMPLSQETADSGGPTGAPLMILGRTIDPDRSSRVTGWVLAPENFSGRVQVLLDDVVRDTVGADGSFAIDNVSAGARRLTFRGSSVAIRHVSLNVETGQSHLLLVTLRTGPVVIVEGSPATVDAVLAEYRRRRRMGGGYFLDRREIAQRNARTLTDLMRSVPGVRVQSEGTGFRYVSSHFRRLPAAGTGMIDEVCDMMIYLDGQPLLLEAGHADARVPVAEIAALEVYVSASSVPREYAGSAAACGVILVWQGR